MIKHSLGIQVKTLSYRTTATTATTTVQPKKKARLRQMKQSKSTLYWHTKTSRNFLKTT